MCFYFSMIFVAFYSLKTIIINLIIGCWLILNNNNSKIIVDRYESSFVEILFVKLRKTKIKQSSYNLNLSCLNRFQKPSSLNASESKICTHLFFPFDRVVK